MNPIGGTEIVYQTLMRHMGSDWNPDINLISCICKHERIIPNKINIIWQQLSYDQDNVKLMGDKTFTDKVDYFVYNSHWAYEKFRNVFNAPEKNSVVIKNSIDKIPFIPKKNTSKLKLIYTSTPWRGLHILLECFERLNRDDVELDVYSSNVIYGKAFEEMTKGMYDKLFARAKSMKNVNYMGYASNAGIRRALQNAHIYTYPSIFEETSCIAAIEAGAAGCKILVTNFGALYETCSDWATFVTYTKDYNFLIENYTKELNRTIDSYKHDDVFHKRQSDYYNEFFTWDRKLIEWKTFLSEASNAKK